MIEDLAEQEEKTPSDSAASMVEAFNEQNVKSNSAFDHDIFTPDDIQAMKGEAYQEGIQRSPGIAAKMLQSKTAGPSGSQYRDTHLPSTLAMQYRAESYGETSGTSGENRYPGRPTLSTINESEWSAGRSLAAGR